MPKFVLAYHGGSMAEDPEEQQRVMQAWGEWFGAVGSDMVDPGNQTGNTKTVASDGTVDDGGPNPLTGYSIINAADMDAAIAYAKDCPVNLGGGNVEVAQAFDM